MTTTVHQERFVAIPVWVLDRLHGDGRAVAVYAALAAHAGPAGDCWPGRARLAEMVGCGLDTLDRIIGRLVTAGVVQRDSGKQAGTTSTYRLPLDNPDPGVPQNRGRGAAKRGQGGAAKQGQELDKEELDKGTSASAVQRVWDAWVETLPEPRRGRQRKAPNAPSRAKIESRLREGMTEEELIAAVTAWPRDPWPHREQFCTIPTLLRNRDTAERWRDMSTPVVVRGVAGALAAIRAMQEAARGG